MNKIKKKIPGTETIPIEFQLSNYDVCTSWGLREWANALMTRWEIREHWKHACGNGQGNVPKEMLEHIHESAERILKNPISNIPTSPHFFLHRPLVTDQSAYDYFCSSDTCEDPAYAEWYKCFLHTLYDNHDDFHEENEGVGNEINEKIARDIKLVLETPAWDMHRQVSTDSIQQNNFTISVNLGAPNDALVRDFKKWIIKTRKAANIPIIPKPYNKEDFEKWHADRLLPYLDLTFWATLNKVTLKHTLIGQILSSKDDERNPDERVRRTIKPNANKLISDEVVASLTRMWICKPKSGFNKL